MLLLTDAHVIELLVNTKLPLDVIAPQLIVPILDKFLELKVIPEADAEQLIDGVDTKFDTTIICVVKSPESI